jgi:glycerate 2-kinase
MPLKLLIVPDKFKGTLTAAAAAKAIAIGWRRARPRDVLQLLPMSDGGDGFGEVMGRMLGARIQKVKTVDAAHRPCTAPWWWESKSKTAVIESANVIGLAMLPPGTFHPFELDTFGLGAVLRAARDKGAKHILVGIGGSATNDGGFGLARALGWEFFDQDGKPILRWTVLRALTRIQAPQLRRFARVIVAVDVQNPLLGPRGATRVFGPQKGLRRGDFARAERCLRQLARVANERFGRDFACRPGAGAAGGLGFGLLAFTGAKLEPGYALFARHAKLSRRLRAAGLVITGEGAIDRSTFMGKGVGQIARACRKLEVPCIGMTGATADLKKANRLFTEVRTLTELTTVKRARARPAIWLERLAAKVAREWS